VAGAFDPTMALALRAAAAALAGPAAGEPDAGALRAALAAALERGTGRLTMVIRGDTARLRGWPEPIGPVDLGVRNRIAGRHRALADCAWWDGAEARAGTVRDACLLASAARLSEVDAYLVAGAPAAGAPDHPAARLLAGGEWATVPLLRDAGVAAVGGGPGSAVVPARIRSTFVVAAPLGRPGAAWELRAARIGAAGGDVTLVSE
jgi:hypothetical protein